MLFYEHQLCLKSNAIKYSFSCRAAWESHFEFDPTAYPDCQWAHYFLMSIPVIKRALQHFGNREKNARLRLKVTLFVHQQLNSLLIHLFISHILIHLLSEQLLDNQHSLPSCLLSQNACNSMTSKCWKVHAQEATCSESKARTHKGTNCCRCFSSSITYTVFLSFVCCRKKKYIFTCYFHHNQPHRQT